MMSLSKTLLSLAATVLIGSLSVLVSTPNKVLKSKANQAKTNTRTGIDDKENLFI